ncbi:MAG: peptidoglycan DD-metalloendopeptidase family protein [gamma proteobacterium endosymbiont of Lamellibrachia anaximandri]|nr:peptidoglycan DD-metalloendopeptidase family protein [gamma proteobacterium endosymbiont of Lamellibrachia anaximandri]
MQDFKSYSLDRKPSRFRQLLRAGLVILLLLAIAAAGALFLDNSKDSQTTAPIQLPTKAEPSQENGRIVVPLALPGQSREESRAEPQVSPPPLAKAPAPSTIVPPVKPVSVPSEPDLESLATASKSQWISRKIRSGDSLSSIFKENGLSANLLHRIVNSSKMAKELTRIKPGETLRLQLDDSGSLLALALDHNRVQSLHIRSDGDSFLANEENKPIEHRTAHTSGTITNSLYLSAQDAGLADALIMELANIFGWDIDFALEIRSGDRFSVIYQEDYLEGDKLKDGPILAAEFINQGRSYRALRYTDETGQSDYFTPEGRSMRKAFLRAPVDFRRISSRFTGERWHPVLGKKRPHRGVDYAAKTGTPIKAAGDGKIIHRGKKGGYGRTVIVQHGQRYTTLYAHLSRYNKTAKKGSKVRQGQTIGYVGKSGLATGPHLHYEFRVNGVHRNPLTVKLPAAQPIAKKYKVDFLLKTQPLVSQLDVLNRTLIADAQ